MKMHKVKSMHRIISSLRLLMLIAAMLCFFTLAEPHAQAAVRVGAEINTAMTGAAAVVELESKEGSLFRMAMPTSGDAIKVTWHKHISSGAFDFYIGPELEMASSRHRLTAFAGYGFGYGLGRGPARLGLHTSIGLADGPAMQNRGTPWFTLGSTNFRLSTLSSLSLCLSF